MNEKSFLGKVATKLGEVSLKADCLLHPELVDTYIRKLNKGTTLKVKIMAEEIVARVVTEVRLDEVTKDN